jgi:hypothetical protein
MFPAATVMGIAVEQEDGVRYYEVVVEEGARLVEVEVTAEGAVGEIETAVTLEELPEPAKSGVVAASRGAAVTALERHEIRGVPRAGTFARVDPPRVAYEFACEIDGKRRAMTVGADGLQVGKSPFAPPSRDGRDDDDDDDDDDDGDDDDDPDAD